MGLILSKLDEDSQIEMRDELKENPNKERHPTTKRINEEEGRDNGEPKLCKRVHATEEQLLLHVISHTQESKDLDKITRDGVGTAQLSQGIGHERHLNASKVGTDEERLTENRLPVTPTMSIALSLLRKLVSDRSQL